MKNPEEDKQEETINPPISLSEESIDDTQSREEGAEESETDWESFQELTGGNFNKLLGCGG